VLEFIALSQFCVFIFFITLEKLFPARDLQRANGFHLWWVFLNGISLTWGSLVFLIWTSFPSGFLGSYLTPIQNGILFYLIWSFIGYWWHRFRHANDILWHVIHKFHHSPPRMETAVAFFKHPFEYFSNTCLITLIAWGLGIPAESIVLGLAIEGILETYHHSNIKTPRCLRRIGYLVQTPEMHLIHHERGLHRFNYATVLWDSVFGTVRIPEEWNGKQGLKAGNDIKSLFLLKN